MRLPEQQRRRSHHLQKEKLLVSKAFGQCPCLSVSVHHRQPSSLISKQLLARRLQRFRYRRIATGLVLKASHHLFPLLFPPAAPRQQPSSSISKQLLGLRLQRFRYRRMATGLVFEASHHWFHLLFHH